MSATQTQTVNSKVEQVDVNLDEIFNAAPSGADMIQDTKAKPKSIFSRGEKADMSFADPDISDVDDLDAKVEETKVEETTKETTEEVKAESKPEVAEDILDSLDNVEEEEETKKEEKRGRKSINGISDVFGKLIKDDKIVPFDDDKALEEYSAKDWEELIEANLEEKANQVRRETPKQFFQSLPQELQIAAKYVADGGKDLKGLFSTLSQVEQHKELNIKKAGDQGSYPACCNLSWLAKS